MRLLIATNNLNAPGAERLRQAAVQAGLDVRVTTYSDGSIVPNVHWADYVIFRISPQSAGFLKGTLLRRIMDTPHYNTLENALTAFSKVDSWKLLSRAGLPVPWTRHIRTKDDIAEIFPSVLKVSNGNQGKGVFLVNTLKDAVDALEEIVGADEAGGVQQEFIYSADNSDKRIFVVGGEVVAAMKRKAREGEFRANIHQGGKAVSYRPSSLERDISVRAVECLGLDFAGVDIMGDDDPRILEVNPSPGFAVEEITGENIVEKIISYIEEEYDSGNHV